MTSHLRVEWSVRAACGAGAAWPLGVVLRADPTKVTCRACLAIVADRPR